MDYRWCQGCRVLIPATQVFCSDNCHDAYFMVDETGLSRKDLARLRFVLWSRTEGYAQFKEEYAREEVVTSW